MLTIRLHRQGKKNQPFFKIVVTDKKNSSTRGRFVEEVGFYNPLTKEKKVIGDRIKYWISVGAKPSDTVHNLLVTEKVIDSPKIAKHKKAKKKEEGATVVPTADKAAEDKQEQSVATDKSTVDKQEEPTPKKTETKEESAASTSAKASASEKNSDEAKQPEKIETSRAPKGDTEKQEEEKKPPVEQSKPVENQEKSEEQKPEETKQG